MLFSRSSKIYPHKKIKGLIQKNYYKSREEDFTPN